MSTGRMALALLAAVAVCPASAATLRPLFPKKTRQSLCSLERLSKVTLRSGQLHLQPLAQSSETKSYKIVLIVGADRHEIEIAQGTDK